MKHLFYLLIISLLSGCSENVTFNKPQPPDTASINSFPKKLQGKYIHKDGAGTGIEITSDLIKDIVDAKIAIKDLDSNQVLSGDTLSSKTSGEKYKITRISDSIYLHIDLDTIFAISENNILKKYKGYYFANIKLDKEQWKVYRINICRNMLVSGQINDSSDIATLKELSPSTQDSTGYLFHPSQKQFEKYLKKDGFQDRDTFYKISSPIHDTP